VATVETDLGDFLLQLASETPSHIIAPAIHKTRQQAAALLSRESGRPLSPDDLSALTGEARRILRKRFLAAGMGISGGNIAVAETGSVVLVTNEGNGRLVTSVPPVHIAVIGIEKIAPTWDEAAVWLSLLARSAAGQPLSIYTSIITGPARSDDPDGAKEVHIVLLDNGRSQLVGTKYEEVLQCIRCGACLNVCPVYSEAGGHAYSSPYCGPIGAVITPLLFGLEDYEALPHASSLCGACKDVCPVRIDLPRMLLELRTDEVTEGVLPWRERKVEAGMAKVLGHEKLMRFVAGAVRLAQRPFVHDGSLSLPGRLNPVLERRVPGLAKRAFREMWDAGELEDKR
jgi:L-lactate dehydrogenase complex protein LldF